MTISPIRRSVEPFESATGKLLTLVFVLFSTGCVENECATDYDCDFGNEYCNSQGMCIRGETTDVECRRDGECGFGNVCSAGRCETRPPSECSSDGECASNQFCSEGQCRARLTHECGSHGDCAPNEYCSAGDCVSGGGEEARQCVATNAPVPDVCCPSCPNMGPMLMQYEELWGTRPDAWCTYDPGSGLPATNACQHPPGAWYCPIDRSIAISADFWNGVTNQFGFGAIRITIAHEVGHLNQHLAGLTQGQFNKALELHADCQSGVWAAYAVKKNMITQPELDSAFNFLCAVGDQFPSEWFHTAHGTCPERQGAFLHGFNVATANFDVATMCADPRRTMIDICG